MSQTSEGLRLKGYVETSDGFRRVPKEDAVQINEQHEPVSRERDLHDDLIDFYNAQWPRWKVIYARQDKRSTIPVGCQDHTVFASGCRVFCLELKKKNGKPDADQLAWHKEMEMLGHRVHIIYNLIQFLEVIEK